MSLYLGDTLISGAEQFVGESRNIGQIIPSTIPLTDAGLHLLDGALIQGSGIYSAFVTYISGLVSTYPDLFITEADWQSSVSTYGVCGKFVYDSVNNTVRLPKITGILEGTTDATALGDLVQAGLPNITGQSSLISSSDGTGATGAFGWTRVRAGQFWENANNDNGHITFDASRSNSIYGNSSTVQPQTIKCYYYIVIATSTKTDIQVDIDEVVTDLNGKADVDLTNCTKPHIVETYVNGTSWYRVYSDGWCEQGGIITGAAVVNLTGSVTFLKPYYDTNYLIATQAARNNNDSAYINNQSYVYNKVNTGFTAVCYGDGTSTMIMWQACGYIR